MTLREYIIFWQETYDKHQSRPTTYAAHNYVFKNHILPGLGDIPLSELTSEMIGDFLEGKPEFDNPIPKTTSNPMNNDRLSGISIGFSYDFWTRDCDCPGGTLDKGRKASPQKIVKQKEPKKKKRNQRFQ